MDVFEMSLINKMLQDLEGRRLDGEAVGALHGQVRATPDIRRMHAARWVSFGLALIVTGVISWFWGYRAAPTMVPGELMPQLASAIAPDNRLPPVPDATAAVEEKFAAAPLVAASTSRENTKNIDSVSSAAAGDRNPDGIARSELSPTLKPSPLAAPGAKEMPAASAVVAAIPAAAAVPASVAPRGEVADKPAARKEAGKTVAGADENDGMENRSSQKSGKVTEFDIPAHVAKEMKELTPHQRAEEEFRRATVLLDQGKTGESITALEKALQFEPRHSLARQSLAGLLLEAQRSDEAIRTLQQGLKVEKDQPALAMMLARLQVDKGELRPAVETLQRTLPYSVERADYQAFLAALLQREGRHKEAAEHYLRALSKSPQNGLWWMGIAISLHADNRLADARDAFARAKASNNLSPELMAFVDEKLRQLH